MWLATWQKKAEKRTRPGGWEPRPERPAGRKQYGATDSGSSHFSSPRTRSSLDLPSRHTVRPGRHALRRTIWVQKEEERRRWKPSGDSQERDRGEKAQRTSANSFRRMLRPVVLHTLMRLAALEDHGGGFGRGLPLGQGRKEGVGCRIVVASFLQLRGEIALKPCNLFAVSNSRFELHFLQLELTMTNFTSKHRILRSHSHWAAGGLLP